MPMADDTMDYSGAAAPSTAQGEDAKPEVEESETALLPKSLLGTDCKPGDRYTVEVVAVHGDDEVEVKGAGHADDEEAEGEGGKEMSKASGRMNDYATEE